MKLNKNAKYVGAIIKNTGIKVVLPVTCVALLITSISLYQDKVRLEEEVNMWRDGALSQTKQITSLTERVEVLEESLEFSEEAQELLISYIYEKTGDDVVIYGEPTVEIITDENNEPVDSEYKEKPKIWVRRLPGEKIQ